MGKIKKSIKRISEDKIEEFIKIPTTILSDVQNRGMTMTADINPVIDNDRIVGQAITVEEMVGCNVMLHKALYIAEAGDILVADVKDHVDTSVWGGIQTKVAKDREIEGLIVNGSVRDVKDIKDYQFPVYCKGIVPAGPHKGFAGKINHSISCGGIKINPGDLIVADRDGVVVVPYENINSVLKDSIDRLEEEKRWLKKINSGSTTIEAVGLEEKVENLNFQLEE